jgi:hypothetical protein
MGVDDLHEKGTVATCWVGNWRHACPLRLWFGAAPVDRCQGEARDCNFCQTSSTFSRVIIRPYISSRFPTLLDHRLWR